MTELYHYSGRLGDGKFVAGTMRAGSQAQAIAQLKTRRMFITSLDRATGVRSKLRMVWPLASMQGHGCTAFVRSLGVLIVGGTPLRRALQVTINQCDDARFAEALCALASDIDSGAALSEAMSRRPREFSERLVAMVRAGELGGTLDEVLERAAILLEREEALRKHVIHALAYPAFVSAASLLLVAFLLVFTVPAFRSILEQLHGQLPLSTRVLIGLSEMVRQPYAWAVFVGSMMPMAALLIALRRNAEFTDWIQRRSLSIPLAGPIRRSVNIAAFSRTVGTLLRSGVIITDAVRTAATVVENSAYRLFTRELERSLREGMPFAHTVESSRLFGPIFAQMVVVGEETGSLDSVLLQMAEYYESDARVAITSMTTLLEPALILILGTVVGTIVGSILLPLYAAIGNIH